MFQHHNQFVSGAVGLVLHAAMQLSEACYDANQKEDASSTSLIFVYHKTTQALPFLEPELLAQLCAMCNQLLFWNDFSTRVERKEDSSTQTILWPADYSRPESLVLTSTFGSFYFLKVIKIVHIDQEQLCHLNIRPFGINGQLFKLQFALSPVSPTYLDLSIY